MEKPKPKDFGFDTKYQTWPDKVKRQKYRHAMSEYQKFIFAQSQEKDIEIDVLQVGQEQLAQTIIDVISDRDQFAIGFAEWVMKDGWRYNKHKGNWSKDVNFNSFITKTTAELLELYKASLTPNT